MKKYSAVISVILAGVLWGLIGVFIKNLSLSGLDSIQIAFVRMLIASVSFKAFILVKDKSLLKISLKDIWMFIGTGIISVSLFNICYFYTIIKSEASLAVVLLYTSPVFVVLFSALLFKERITIGKVTALVLSFAGCVLTAGVLGGVKVRPFVILTGIASGLFYALYSVFGKFALKKYSTYTVTAYTFIFGLLGDLFISGPIETVSAVIRNPHSVLWCLGIGIISTVMPYFLYTRGLEKLESGKAAILVAVEPLVGAVIGMVFLNESHNISKIAGIILILISIVLLNINFKEVKKDEN
ncbi:MAG: EamA family transporter [Clostridia bacterium]|nr:EamA family transporter [Clostridia bacterium]